MPLCQFCLEILQLKISAQETIDLLSDIKLISYNLGTEYFEKITKVNDKNKLILKNLNIKFI